MMAEVRALETGVAAGILYLALSDLFYLGFAFHPYGGYFLTVHGGASRGEKVAATSECQPTSSTYSVCNALATMNLTLHVEHHDFPRVPWCRLPKLRQIAPTFYDSLRPSPGLAASMWNHYVRFRHAGSERPHYACT